MENQKSLKERLNRLEKEKAAFQAQSRLLENFVVMARSAVKDPMLHTFLQQTLEVSAHLTGAEKGSLFLLNAAGAVTHSILTRGETSSEQRTQIIGRVLDKGLVGWVRSHRKVGLVQDTKTDHRWHNFRNQPYTVGSALAVPILRGDDLVGLMTLLHAKPGHFSDESAELMQLTAGQIGVALENARLYTKLDEYSMALDAELEKGKRIQMDFLPNQIPNVDDWEIECYFRPALQVSGDFYDAFHFTDNHVGLVLADVCDKGVGSALYMALFRSLIRIFSGQIHLGKWSAAGIGELSGRPDHEGALQAVSLTNDYIAKEHGRVSMFATLFYGILNTATGDLAYINAGHEPLHIIGGSGIEESLDPKSLPVGAVPGTRFIIDRTRMAPGHTLIGCTDGVTEALSPEQRQFSKERFLSLLNRPAASAAELVDRIKTDLNDHMDNAPQFDDITMIAVHRKTQIKH